MELLQPPQPKLKGFDKLCDSVNCTRSEKEAARRGAQLFFDKGWPASCFTVPMAIAASRGQIPNQYMRARSRTQYEYQMTIA